MCSISIYDATKTKLVLLKSKLVICEILNKKADINTLNLVLKKNNLNNADSLYLLTIYMNPNEIKIEIKIMFILAFDPSEKNLNIL